MPNVDYELILTPTPGLLALLIRLVTVMGGVSLSAR